MPTLNPINSRRLPRFVDEYVRDPNGTRAALAAGWPKSWAHVAACELLKEPKVQQMIADRRAELAARAGAVVEEVVQQWLAIERADPTKIMRTRRLNCRHCWGVGHEYQWSAREYAQACEAAAAARNPRTGEPAPNPMPDCAGGFGWVFNAEPNADCPECRGEGVEDVFVADMESLGPDERKLIASVKRTKDGLEVKMHDQAAARDNIAKYLGMLIERKELTGKDGVPLVPTTIVVCGPDE